MKKILISLFTIIIVIGGDLYLSKLKSLELEPVPEKNTEETKNIVVDETEARKLIGQMLIVGFRGTIAEKNSYIVRTINNLNIGGIILFDYDVPMGTKGRNIVNPEQTKKLVSDIVSNTTSSLLVSVDAEGGKVNRLKPAYGFADIPSHETLGKGTEEKTYAAAKKLGQELSELGINFDFAPVADVNVNPENPVIGKLGRSFGSDANIVSLHATAFIQGLHASGILTSIKHFPGHGSSATDSHLGMVDITDSYKTKELDPFRTLVKNGLADTVMVAHVFDRNIDPDYPASLSEKFIHGVLRNDLGFAGVIISDDMDMGAIRKNYGFEEAIAKAVRAGNDILILSNNGEIYDESTPKRAIDAIWNAVQSGDVPLSDIRASVERIGVLKEKI